MIACLSRKESSIQTDILNHLKKIDKAYFFKTLACNRKGVPDIVGVYRGVSVWIEVKTAKGRLSALQAMAAENIRQSGGRHITARCLNDVMMLLREIDAEVENES